MDAEAVPYGRARPRLHGGMTTNGSTHQIALVTGATRGIGREVARQLAAAGHVVYLGARDAAAGATVAAELAEAGDVRPLRLDVTDVASIAAAVERVEAEAGRLDVLVNNAGVNLELTPEGPVALPDVEAETVRATFETNVVGLIAVTNALLPLLRRAPGARIVNLSSDIASLRLMTEPDSRAATRRMLAYSSSKAAVNAATLLYANELREERILVNAASPGFVSTDLTHHKGALPVEEGARVPVLLATLGPDGPTGTFLAEDGTPEGSPAPW